MKLRFASIQDIKALSDIESVCFPQAEAASYDQLEERFQAFPENFLVLEDAGRVIGFINGNTSSIKGLPDIFYEEASLHDPQGDYMTVFGLDVHPDYQHQGLAHQLMEGYISLARQRGKKGIFLTCKDHLIGFYEGFGYQHLGVSSSTHGEAKWNDMYLEVSHEC